MTAPHRPSCSPPSSSSITPAVAGKAPTFLPARCYPSASPHRTPARRQLTGSTPLTYETLATDGVTLSAKKHARIFLGGLAVELPREGYCLNPCHIRIESRPVAGRFSRL